MQTAEYAVGTVQQIFNGYKFLYERPKLYLMTSHFYSTAPRYFYNR